MSERLLKTPAGVQLGPLNQIENNQARNFVLEIGVDRFHGFIVRKDDKVFGYVDVCPHRALPLAIKLDQYMTPQGDLIVCSWHGAVFQPTTGLCVGGPCRGQILKPWPVANVGGILVTL